MPKSRSIRTLGRVCEENDIAVQPAGVAGDDSVHGSDGEEHQSHKANERTQETQYAKRAHQTQRTDATDPTHPFEVGKEPEGQTGKEIGECISKEVTPPIGGQGQSNQKVEHEETADARINPHGPADIRCFCCLIIEDQKQNEDDEPEDQRLPEDHQAAAEEPLQTITQNSVIPDVSDTAR